MDKIHVGLILVATMMVATPSTVAIGSTHSINSTVISASGMNSAGKYYYCSGTFENYCPECKCYGRMEWNPKGTIEGEWTCKHCDADYSINGRCKAGQSNVYLVPYKTPLTTQQTTPESQLQSQTTQNILTILEWKVNNESALIS